jgi:hypothetical protein
MGLHGQLQGQFDLFLSEEWRRGMGKMLKQIKRRGVEEKRKARKEKAEEI